VVLFQTQIDALFNGLSREMSPLSVSKTTPASQVSTTDSQSARQATFRKPSTSSDSSQLTVPLESEVVVHQNEVTLPDFIALD